MKHYKNTTERILGTIQEQIYNQNEDVRKYGHTSNQATISRLILNATLITLVTSNVVVVNRSYLSQYYRQIITGLDLSLNGHRCFVSEVDYEIFD